MELSFYKIEREKLREYVAELNKSSKNIHGLLNNLLYWAMSQSGGMMPRKESLMIEDMIRKVTQSENTNASVKNISLEISTNENFQVFADPMMLETVLRNVLSNAIKFSPDHSVVAI